MASTGAAAPIDIHVVEVPSGGRFVQLTHSPHDGVDLANARAADAG